MMLPYHESFKQLSVGTWLVPVGVVLLFASTPWIHGVRPAEFVWTLAGLVALISLGWIQVIIWVSVWGTRHQISACLGACLFFIMPFSILLAPLLELDVLPRGALSVGILITLAIALLLSAVFHYRRAQVPAQARVLKWSGCEIDLRKCVIRQSQADSGLTGGVAIAVVAGFSVTLYHFLNSLLPKQGMIILGVVIGFAMGLWLCLWLLGRALGQAWRLRQIEKRDHVRFVTDRMAWLTQERQRSVIGRWWARRVS